MVKYSNSESLYSWRHSGKFVALANDKGGKKNIFSVAFHFQGTWISAAIPRSKLEFLKHLDGQTAGF